MMSNSEVISSSAKDELIFSLDIGTRNVVGTLARLEDDVYTVVDHETMEHPERAMFDGQIHDIGKVARVAGKVKEVLELRNHIKIEKVAIAAAGRALRTTRVVVFQDIDYTKEINKDVIDSIEVEAIQAAGRDVAPGDGEKEMKYYCVGYNVIRYYLDDSIILNPIGHRGSELKVEVIATFLPHIVVDSLYSVMSKIGLEVLNMTLEPIAAINVAIPQNVRLLNLALVDVGAGTSDIAITKDGAVVSFAMVSIAGDEITEAVSREYLLDFNTAESVKTSLSTSDEVSFTDIVGLSHTLKSADVLERISETIDKVAGEIAEKLIEANGKPPSALFFIGGGCQIPGLTSRVAEIAGCPRERAVIKGVDSIANLRFECEPFIGSEYVTPVGIGYSAASNVENDFVTVTVNDKTVRLFNSRQLTVSDALVLIGYSARKLLSVKGEGYFITENGESRRVFGTYGEPARIFVNGAISSLDRKIRNKDFINIEPATEGRKVFHSVSDYLSAKSVKVNGEHVSLCVGTVLDGKAAEGTEIIGENSVLSYEVMNTVGQVAEAIGLPMDSSLTLNGALAPHGTPVKPGDRLAVDSQADEEENLGSSGVSRIGAGHEISANDAASEALDSMGSGRMSGVRGKGGTFVFTVNGETVSVISDKEKLVFVDIFQYYSFDLSRPRGVIELKLNGEKAQYGDELKSGDVIDIAWV